MKILAAMLLLLFIPAAAEEYNGAASFGLVKGELKDVDISVSGNALALQGGVELTEYFEFRVGYGLTNVSASREGLINRRVVSGHRLDSSQIPEWCVIFSPNPPREIIAPQPEVINENLCKPTPIPIYSNSTRSGPCAISSKSHTLEAGITAKHDITETVEIQAHGGITRTSFSAETDCVDITLENTSDTDSSGYLGGSINVEITPKAHIGVEILPISAADETIVGFSASYEITDNATLGGFYSQYSDDTIEDISVVGGQLEINFK